MASKTFAQARWPRSWGGTGHAHEKWCRSMLRSRQPASSDCRVRVRRIVRVEKLPPSASACRPVASCPCPSHRRVSGVRWRRQSPRGTFSVRRWRHRIRFARTTAGWECRCRSGVVQVRIDRTSRPQACRSPPAHRAGRRPLIGGHACADGRCVPIPSNSGSSSLQITLNSACRSAS